VSLRKKSPELWLSTWVLPLGWLRCRPQKKKQVLLSTKGGISHAFAIATESLTVLPFRPVEGSQECSASPPTNVVVIQLGPQAGKIGRCSPFGRRRRKTALSAPDRCYRSRGYFSSRPDAPLKPGAASRQRNPHPLDLAAFGANMWAAVTRHSLGLCLTPLLTTAPPLVATASYKCLVAVSRITQTSSPVRGNMGTCFLQSNPDQTVFAPGSHKLKHRIELSH
jgi:hypothetical protein